MEADAYWVYISVRTSARDGQEVSTELSIFLGVMLPSAAIARDE